MLSYPAAFPHFRPCWTFSSSAVSKGCSRWDATWLGVTEDQLWVCGFCAAPRQWVRLQHFHFVGLQEGSTSLVQAWDVEGSVTSGNSCVCSLVDGTAKAVVCFIYNVWSGMESCQLVAASRHSGGKQLSFRWKCQPVCNSTPSRRPFRLEPLFFKFITTLQVHTRTQGTGRVKQELTAGKTSHTHI